MSVDQGRVTRTMLLLFLPGALCAAWRVEYREQPICAVTGSSVVILCSFFHPDKLRMKRVTWGHVKPRHPKGRVVFDSGSRTAAARFQYVGDQHGSCSLKIHRVTQGDAGKYIISFNNNRMDAWAGNAGPRLKVVDLNILVAKTNRTEATTEGDAVNLTCVNRCEAHGLSPAFSWFKDGKAINEGRVLSLRNISSADSGNYTCSLKTQAAATSGAVNIDVEYAPRNTTVSVIGPSADVDAGANLTLVCSSRSNPPVERYAWFRMGRAAEEVGHRPDFTPRDRGQYLCSASNRHGSQNSSAVTLSVRSRWAAFTRDVLTAVTLALIAVTVVAVRRLKEASVRAPQTDGGTDTQEEKSEQVVETPEVVYATLNFNNTRKSDTGQHVDRGEEATYSTVRQQRSAPDCLRQCDTV